LRWIAEYDELKRKEEGERKPGGKGGVYKTFVNGEGWTDEKTAKDLNIKQQEVSLAKQIVTAVKEFPDLADHLVA
jgi:hypothetical protein